MIYLQFIVALLILVGAAELLTRASVQLCKRLRLSELSVGALVIGFGTSFAELTTSVEATLSDAPGIAIGNVVGSNTANVLLILALGALIKPLLASAVKWLDLTALAGSAGLLVLLYFFGELDAYSGTLLLFLLVTYVALNIRNGRLGEQNDNPLEVSGNTWHTRYIFVAIAAALTGLFIGADWLVASALGLADELNVAAGVIGLTVVAVGTSLPELAATISMAIRGRTELALGNIIGSNISVSYTHLTLPTMCVV